MCLSLLCVNNGPGNVNQKHMRLVHVQTISIVVLADRPFCMKRFFERLVFILLIFTMFKAQDNFRQVKEHISRTGALFSDNSVLYKK